MFYVHYRLLLVCFLRAFFLLALLITIIYRFCYLVLIQKDIQRVRAKIHILKFMSAALHVGVLDLNQKKDS